MFFPLHDVSLIITCGLIITSIIHSWNKIYDTTIYEEENNPRSWWDKMKDKLSEFSIPVNYILNHQFNEVKYFINQ